MKSIFQGFASYNNLGDIILRYIFLAFDCIVWISLNKILILCFKITSIDLLMMPNAWLNDNQLIKK